MPADHRPRSDRPREPQSPNWIPSESQIEAIIAGDVDVLIVQAEKIGRELVESRLTTSQVRGVFGTVRQIEAAVHPTARELDDLTYRRLKLLIPRLAYQAKRERGQGVARLSDVLTPAIQRIGRDADRFRRFVEFFEAVLAYHKAHGGKEQ